MTRCVASIDFFFEEIIVVSKHFFYSVNLVFLFPFVWHLAKGLFLTVTCNELSLKHNIIFSIYMYSFAVVLKQDLSCSFVLVFRLFG